MATFITLINFTDQGIKSIKDSPERYNAFRAAAEKTGLTIKSVHYTQGRHDMVLVTEGSEEAYMAVGLKLGSLGNVRSETLRGFSVDEFKKFLSKMP
ncbi:MAG: GYD domain-containing protein [Myxococcaceae bacterium]